MNKLFLSCQIWFTFLINLQKVNKTSIFYVSFMKYIIFDMRVHFEWNQIKTLSFSLFVYEIIHHHILPQTCAPAFKTLINENQESQQGISYCIMDIKCKPKI